MENLESTNVESVDTAETSEEQKGKYYTDDEIAKLQQVAGDKRISQYQKTLEKKNREADRLSKMTAEEKYEFALQERERQIEEKERALLLAENKNVVSQILAEKGLSLNFVEFCVDEDADIMKQKISTIEKAFKSSVKAEVEKRLGSKVPTKSLPTENVMTKEQFRKLNVVELTRFRDEQPELFKEFTK